MLSTKFQLIWPSAFRVDLYKSANQKQELPVVVSLYGCGVSEEKIKMRKVNGRRTPSDDKSSHCLWQGGANNMTLRFGN